MQRSGTAGLLLAAAAIIAGGSLALAQDTSPKPMASPGVTEACPEPMTSEDPMAMASHDPMPMSSEVPMDPCASQPPMEPMMSPAT